MHGVVLGEGAGQRAHDRLGVELQGVDVDRGDPEGARHRLHDLLGQEGLPLPARRAELVGEEERNRVPRLDAARLSRDPRLLDGAAFLDVAGLLGGNQPLREARREHDIQADAGRAFRIHGAFCRILGAVRQNLSP